MRNFAVLMTTVMLAGCGGGGTNAISSIPAQTGNGTVGTTTPGTPNTATPTPSPTGVQHSFVSPTVTKTYSAVGSTQTYSYHVNERVAYTKVGTAVDPNSRTVTAVGNVQNSQVYQATAGTVKAPGMTVTYDPRAAQYTLTISQGGISANIAFQDPAHRTDFGGSLFPQGGVPNFEIPGQASWRTRGAQYLQVDSGSSGKVTDVTTFFYELPGTVTSYVTYAGFVRNRYDPLETIATDTATAQTALSDTTKRLERAAFFFGERTVDTDVPKAGTATYRGNMIASMVNANFDANPLTQTFVQWIKGTAQVDIDFGKSTMATALAGTTLSPYYFGESGSPTVNAGAIFSATALGKVDISGSGGFIGTFSSANFIDGVANIPVDIIGGSLDGAFFGPKAVEVGGSFRIIGGIPDQRVDIIGAFSAKGN